MGEMDFYDNGILTILRDGKNRTFQQSNYSDFLIQIFESQILLYDNLRARCREREVIAEEARPCEMNGLHYFPESYFFYGLSMNYEVTNCSDYCVVSFGKSQGT